MKRHIHTGKAAHDLPASPQRPEVMTRDAHDGLIGRLAPGEDPARVAAWIRHEHGTLDNVEPLDFVREVKRAVARIHAQGPQESDQLTRSHGLRLRRRSASC